MNIAADNPFQQNATPNNLPQPGLYNLSDFSDCLVYQYRILACIHTLTSIQQGLVALLETGLQRFEADCVLLTRPVSRQVHEVLAFAGKASTLYVGQHLNIENTPVDRIFQGNETFACRELHKDGVNFQTLSYTVGDVGSCLGAVVKPAHAYSGVLCFLSSNSKREDYSRKDMIILELLAEGAAAMADQQRMQTQRKLTDQAMFALGSVKTLDEYLEQARLPEVFGVPARVVEVLQERIGHAPLSIGHIAEELNLSKRTLQRRLQQQEVNFAELRDQVRFHYSIDYLIKQHLSIDSISASLDFSDRTSFTNAFKRWTGLSPSTFRKLFRDYV